MLLKTPTRPPAASPSTNPSAASPSPSLSTAASNRTLQDSMLMGIFELQVDASTPTSGSITQVNFRIIYSSDSLLLHWGVICDGNENWVLPSRQPEGTKNYKNKALRTPFVESGSSSYLKLEIDDPSIQAIEFIIFDEARNTWIKNNGQNFHVKLPRKETLISNISLPEDLVQIQAYLRWE